LDILKETLEKLKKLEVKAILSNVIITRIGPWTLSYVRYSDGEIGCGCANNEAELNTIPDDVSFIKGLLNNDVYQVLEQLENFRESVFINSLKTSLISALSYRMITSQQEMEMRGYSVESYSRPNTPLLNPSKFIKEEDTVAMVGFHMNVTPLCAQVAKKVRVTELKDLRELSVIDFDHQESNIEIFSADKSEEILSSADVVYITGETIVNNTLGQLLDFSKNARLRIIYGPTCAFYPEALFARGVDISLPVIFPPTSQFHRQFVESRGYWYSLKEGKQLIIKKEESGC